MVVITAEEDLFFHLSVHFFSGTIYEYIWVGDGHTFDLFFDFDDFQEWVF